MRRRRARPAALVLVFAVGLMVAVPAVALVDDQRPARYGWQMFAARNPLPRVEMVTPSGRERVDPRELFARARPEIDHFAVLPAAVCRLRPEATAVVVISPDGKRRERTSC